MSRRRQLEHEVSLAREHMKNVFKDAPEQVKKIWVQQLRDFELELNNLTDEEEDNND